MLRLLPQELKEELWKFVHYVHRDTVEVEIGITKRFHETCATHCRVEGGLSSISPVSPPEPLWFMGSHSTWAREQFLYYSRDGMVVHVHYQHPIGYYTSIWTYRSRHLRDLFRHIYGVRKLIPDLGVWLDAIW